MLSALALLLTAPVSITTIPGARQPQLAVAEGKAWAVFGSGDSVYVASSSSQSLRFGEAVRLPTQGHLALGMRRGPRIAATNGKLVVSAIYGAKGGGTDGDLMAWVSGDGGKSWRRPNPVTDSSGAAREGLHAMAAGSDGTFGCTWLDLRNGSTEIWFASSKDGERWSRNRIVYRSPDGTVCECCNPSIAYRGNQAWVMFRNAVGGNRDMYAAWSEGNSPFTRAQKLGTGTWPLKACPMDGGAIFAGRKIETVWRRGGTIYRCEPGKPEIEIGSGEQPWISGENVVWIGGRGGPLQLWNGRTKIVVAPTAKDPVVVGNLVAWEDQGAGKIFVQKL